MSKSKFPLLYILLFLMCMAPSGFAQNPEAEAAGDEAPSAESEAEDDEGEEDEEDEEKEGKDITGVTPEAKLEAEVEEIKKIKGMYEPKLMDGIPIQAVETYSNPKDKEFGFGLSVFPFDPFRTGFGANGSFTRFYDSQWGWEMLNGTFIFSVDKGLTTELAQDFSVNPREIDEFKAIISSNVLYTFSYGKLLMLKKSIRYFRTQAVGGINIVNTQDNNFIGLTLGIRMDAYVNEKFSWKLELRNHLPFNLNKKINFMAFNLGAGWAF